jgi:hypothetical protein
VGTSPHPDEPPPEFLLDRSLGRSVADGLSDLGWVVHRVSEYFPNDGQSVPDDEWVAFGGSRDWACLAKDKRIAKAAWDAAVAPVFSLSRGTWRSSDMVAAFEAAKRQIWAKALQGDGRSFWIVYEDGRPLHRVFDPSAERHT